MQIAFTLDNQVDIYGRTVFSFLDLFGYIGGLFQIFKMIGAMLVSFYSKKMFYSSILSKFWSSQESKISPKIDDNQDQITRSHDRKIEQNKQNKFKKNKILAFNEKENKSFDSTLKKQLSFEEIKSYLQRKIPDNTENHIKNAYIPNLNDIQVNNNILNKPYTKYSFKDFIWEIWWLHKCQSKRKLWEIMKQRNREFLEGSNSF